MKTYGKRAVSIFLIVILVSSFSVYGLRDTAWGAENPQEAGDTLTEGMLPVRDVFTNKTQNLHVRIEDSEIFAAAEDIGSVCGADVKHDKKEKTLLFDRNGYNVTVYLNAEEAVLSNKEGAVNQQVFPLSNITDDKGNVWLPLEKVMYLLNTGWQVTQDEVLLETPPDTFWNVLNEFENFVSHRPMLSDLLGTGWERFGNSFKYVILSLADELDYRLFIPGLSSGIEAEKYEKAILSLGDGMPAAEDSESVEQELSQFAGMVRTGTEDAANFFGAPHNVSDVGKFLAEFEAKPFHAWEDITDPVVTDILKQEQQWVKSADALAIVHTAFEIVARVTSIQDWNQGFAEQIKAIGELDTSWISDATGKKLAFLIQETADSFYAENQNIILNAYKESLWQIAHLIFSKGFELNAVGKVIAVIDIAVEAVKLISPEFAKALQTADIAYEGKTMIDLSTMATYNCADFLNDLTSQTEIREEDIQNARNSYLLLINTYMRSWDKMIQVKEREGDSYAKQISEWKQMKDEAYVLMIRMNESVKYDSTLIQQSDYGNIYNSDYKKGMVREKIPVSIIEKIYQSDGMAIAGHIAENEDGTIYYWEYDDASFEKSAAAGNYQPNLGEKNRLVKRSPSGEKVLIGDIEGEGSLALAENGLIFYERLLDQAGRREICSIDPDSGQTKTYGEGCIKASDGTYIICADNEANQIDRVNPDNGKRIKLAYGTFLASRENLIYYQPVEKDAEAAARGRVTLAVMDVQGNVHKNLCTTEPDLYSDDWQGASSIMSMVLKEEYIYFSYGSFEGTAFSYAGGKIMRVKKDGTEAEVAAGTNGLQAPVFSVRADGTVVSQSVEEPFDYIYPMDRYFIRDGSIYFMDENGAATELVAQEDYAVVGNVACGQFNENEAVSIRFAEKMGNRVYMLLDHGVIDPESSAGLRTGYARVNSAMLCKDLDTGKVEMLFSY